MDLLTNRITHLETETTKRQNTAQMYFRSFFSAKHRFLRRQIYDQHTTFSSHTILHMKFVSGYEIWKQHSRYVDNIYDSTSSDNGLHCQRWCKNNVKQTIETVEIMAYNRVPTGCSCLYTYSFVCFLSRRFSLLLTLNLIKFLTIKKWDSILVQNVSSCSKVHKPNVPIVNMMSLHSILSMTHMQRNMIMAICQNVRDVVMKMSLHMIASQEVQKYVIDIIFKGYP